MPSSHLLRASDHPPSQTFCLDPSPQGMRKIRDRSARPCQGPDRSDPARAPHRLACSRARPHARCLRSEPARPLTTAHPHPPTEASRAADGARERSALRVDPPGLAGRAGRRSAAPLACRSHLLLYPPSAGFRIQTQRISRVRFVRLLWREFGALANARSPSHTSPAQHQKVGGFKFFYNPTPSSSI